MENKKRISLYTFYFLVLSVFLGWLLFPFFEIQNFISCQTRIPGFLREGLSLPQLIFFSIESLAFIILGIWLLRLILLHFFTDGVATFTMLLVVLGTNYYQPALSGQAMVQHILFTLFALIVWLTIRWHEDPQRKYAISIGLAIGLAIIVSPVNAIILIVPILWGIAGKGSWKYKLNLIRPNLIPVIICFVIILAALFLQTSHWKIQSNTLLNFAEEPAEKFQWIAPYLWQVLFSYQDGWFIYTPLAIFALMGFYILAERNKTIFYATFLFFLVNLFVVSSWPTSSCSDCPGQLSLMSSYIILVIPLGYFGQWIFSFRPAARVMFSTVFIFFILLNLFHTYKNIKRITAPPKVIKEYSFDFENKDFPERNQLTADIVKSGQFAYRMDTGMRFSPGFKSTYGELSIKSKFGIRMTVWVYSKRAFLENPASLVVTSIHEGLNYRYETVSLENEDLKPGKWNQVTMYYLTPESPDPKDIIHTCVWYRGEKELFIDDLNIELFIPKE